METVGILIDFILHIDKHLLEITQTYGAWTYLILFIIVFCETGLVVTPFLPGDSLLFAAGALAGAGSLNVYTVSALLLLAAVSGNASNYTIGSFIGPKVFEWKNSRIFKKEYLEKTQSYFEKYGAKTIVVAQFVPIVRTFSPFLAGVGKMRYLKFATYNVVGAVAWNLTFVFGGYFFGGLPFVKSNFTLVIFVIIGISLMPAIIEAVRTKLSSNVTTERSVQ